MELNKLYLMDCMKGMKEFPNKYFDLAIVDPPYGIKESAHRNISRIKLAKTKMYKKEFWDSEIPKQEYFDEVLRISKNQIIFGINYFVSKRTLNIGSGRIFWDKCNGDSDFSDGEIAYSSFHHSTRMFRFKWSGMMQGIGGNGSRMQGDKSKNEKRIHPTQKPVQIYKWILNRYATPDMKIIDTHVGSGSSIIAFEDFGCEWIGFEIDEDSYKDATRRIEYHKLQYTTTEEFFNTDKLKNQKLSQYEMHL